MEYTEFLARCPDDMLEKEQKVALLVIDYAEKYKYTEVVKNVKARLELIIDEINKR